ncbi:cation-transporting P-type ATPase [Aquibaculum arenosum]|uniref:Cation-transporting P-type ATPase n=1 Tax=Aquibaculum arenosum TaxID=3032591 RepID=A0ABT5YNA3_9PROT|nr:cation-transporting P-type ATPase [Fodinicurvata sp. CAU 1616]MDF2096413.1 cation-transporting P-type ATPase [Fodinicurvata sp. CAU 1616]
MPDASDTPPPWHHRPVREIFEELATSERGLADAEAERRLEEHGPNRLQPPKGRGPLRRFLAQFENVLIQVLVVAALITALLGHWIDSAVILGVVIINAAVGFFQEGKAERALEAIRDMLSPEATVVRDGQRRTIDAGTLVPGDLVLLKSGDKVPADLRLHQTRSLQVQEAALTGESLPSEKDSEPVEIDALLGDRRSMAYAGTLVTQGKAAGVVVATGPRTEIGRISGMMADVAPMTTPLLRKMAQFGRWLSLGILVLAALTFAFGILLRDYDASEMFLAAVGLAVAAIPEGLPAILTITLAIGVTRMAGRNAIIRRLPAVETLGSVTVICSDKTGTLTRNELSVQRLITAEYDLEVSGTGYGPEGTFSCDGNRCDPKDLRAVEAALLGGLRCNDAELHETAEGWILQGNPTDGALLALAAKAGRDLGYEQKACPRSDVIPFESEHKFMASLHHDHRGQRMIYVKGAPEIVLERCDRELAEAERRPIDREAWLSRIEALADQGMRVLAIAEADAAPDKLALTFDDVKGGLTLLGIYGIIDLPRDEAIAAVARCHRAGIAVRMITGDHGATALAIARKLGLGQNGKVLTGQDLATMDQAALEGAAGEVEVFARTTPEQKLRLVEALQRRGEVVAMTGDGVNDAPALKTADVGVAMGHKGTEAAKEASEMVLADDNFASIAQAVEEGRRVYDNLNKAILFILPTNGGEAFVIIAAILLGLSLPITPVQILWVNMITAVTLALALAFEKAELDIMDRPPRPPREPLLSGFLLWRILLVSLLLLGAALGLFLWLIQQGASLEVARTAAVNALVVGEITYLINTRHLRASCLSWEALTGSRPVLIAIGVVVVLQGLFTYAPPMQLLFGSASLGGQEWALIFGGGLLLFGIVEIEKAVRRRWW